MAAGTVIELITQIAGAVSAVAAATALLIKPVRARIFGLSATQDGLRWVLNAADILPAPGGKKDLPI